jgi:DNA replication protein DnaC
MQTEINQSLKTVLRRLKLSGILSTLPDRLAYANKAKLTYQDLLELALQDEIERRDRSALQRRIRQADFEEVQTLEDFDWDSPVTFDRARVRTLFGLGFLHRKEDVIFMGHAGVAKSFLATALGHAVCRNGKKAFFIRADVMLKQLNQARADHSVEKALVRLITPDLLIVDDFGLRRLDHRQSSDMYEIILERHRRSSTIFTSNRSIEEWVPLFDDPVLAQSAMDRLAHNAHQIIIEGESYRKKQGPTHDQEGSEPPSNGETQE